MLFTELNLKGAYIIEPELVSDERGFFARTFCRQEFADHGLNPCIAQCNISSNTHKGTLRGMHYQVSPHAEAKLLSCIRGAIYDVIIDLREDSRSYMQWLAVELSAENRKLLYIPEGFAHGFQTLEDNTEVLYQMSEFYHPECARGIRWDDPLFGIPWPIDHKAISTQDQLYELFKEEAIK